MRQHRRSFILPVFLAVVACSHCVAEEFDATQIEFFETRIRPVLVEQCYSCHNSATTADGSLALDHRAGVLKGGDGGTIVVPGKPAESRLLAVLRHEVPDMKMPQDGAKLDDRIIADFEKWIAMGAADPRDQPPTAEEIAKETSWEAVFARRMKWWSLQPIVKREIPSTRDADWSSHPVDQFLLAAMEQQELSPAQLADRQALLRRVTYTLTGLPPSPEEVRAFVADRSPSAYAAVVDRLLDSPRFGERWARHWMDLVRYCESHGSQGDPELPNAYRYRDYLIRAFNNDVPYDQLVREHLAGDVLPEPRWNVTEKFNESAIGAAHLRMTELGYVPVDALDDQVKVVDNQIDVYSKAFLGMTVSCARCHNHKFDPISQEDFYALYGIFASCQPGQVLIDSPELLDRHRTELVQLKQTLRAGLATAWLEAASSMGARLQEETEREAQIADASDRLRRLRDSIAAIEDPARAAVLRSRDAQASDAQASDAQACGALPTPAARWSFESDARDSMGGHHGELLSGAVIRNGRLILDGVSANMRTVPLDRDIHEKTLEAWCSLANLNQHGGGVIGLDTPEGQFFDSIVFGELKPGHWMAGSDFYNRSQNPAGAAETAGQGELVHIAIVYATDNSITVYRNGQQYGQTYQKGTLRPFLKGKSRFLFGQRLSDVNPPFAGEVEEARAYTRALTADEVAASFRAGAAGITTEELAAFLSAGQRDQLTALRDDDAKLRKQLSSLQSKADAADAWVAALVDARSNNENPLHVWRQLSMGERQSPDLLHERWTKLADHWRAELDSRREFNQTRFAALWDLRTDQHRQWFRSGTGLSPEPRPNGGFAIEATGDRVVRGIHPAGIFTNGLSSRHTGVLTSPRFVIKTNSISVRTLGRSGKVRLVIENYPLGNGGLYPAAGLDRDELGWLRLDTAYRKGATAYLEFITDPVDRAFFGAAEVVTSNEDGVPRETITPMQGLLKGDSPTSLNELALRYSVRLQQAIRAWESQSIDEDDTAFLNYFLRSNLLPTTVDKLPALRESIERYRLLEQNIPVPRRAPGVLEMAAFDQPLFERGQHTRPAQVVPRRGLSLLGSLPYKTSQSGRLELAEETASPANPLTARVMVNRLWHHVFGQGLVETVDNFGHLGKRPTHPELLDYLAAHFIKHRWSVKKSLRLLVTSRTFQQSSLPSDAALRVDPRNRFLSHMPVQRLDAEAIRDSMLATAGQLDLTMFGPGIDVYYTTKTEGGGPKGPLDGDRRRSVYLRIRRNAHNPFLEAFDAPKPSTTRGKRDITNVPVQSLTMLNDPFVIQQAAKWSKQLVALDVEPAERIRLMYLQAFSREPTSAETEATLEYVAESIAEHAAASDEISREELVWQDVAHATFCLKEFIYVE